MLERIRFLTAGESHGKGLLGIIEGLPSNIKISETYVKQHLSRRQKGHGRGGRMKIEDDFAEFIGGVRYGETLGGPIGLQIKNKDWENWKVAMSPDKPDPEGNPKALRSLYLPRPGHADLVGLLKYDRRDTRDILERASARETAARVACGAVCKRLLETFGVTIGSHVTSIGSIEADFPNVLPEKLNESVDGSALRSLDTDATERMKKAIDEAKENGDTLGGIFEIVATGIPAGLGSYVTYDSKLDGRLAGAVMSIQAIKGVEIGAGFSGSFKPGSEVHDPIVADEKATNAGGIGRESNRAGGLEGGVTTGSPIVVKAAMKPISTLRKRLPSIDMRDGSVADAAVERSDVCAVPAAAIVGEAMVALVLADAFLEKFGGDSIAEITRNHNSYLEHLEKRGYGER